MGRTLAHTGFDTPLEPTDRDLSAIIQLVYERSGITLHQGKRQLVTARLQKRVREGGFGSFAAYLAHVQADASGQSMTRLLDSIATNHTHFFREARHFDFLAEHVPELQTRADGGELEGWCAACSTGEEPYTIQMRLHEAGHDAVRLLASDISTKALATARAAVYPMAKVADVPQPLLRSYFEKGLGDQAGLARVGLPLRRLIEFRALNLLEVGSLGRQFDFIFCRNVMIYFDKAIQQRVVTTLERHLKPGGYLFIAHSESLNGITHGLDPIIPAVFRKPA
ncbi:MAG: protein-glutamate O-methyltransferase CheR [Vicinamibacteraceae bacterium]